LASTLYFGLALILVTLPLVVVAALFLHSSLKLVGIMLYLELIFFIELAVVELKVFYF
jgi:hypothetical protein